MCSAAPTIGKVRRFNVRYQGIAGMDGPVAGPHGSRLTCVDWLPGFRCNAARAACSCPAYKCSISYSITSSAVACPARLGRAHSRSSC